jgi:hypothetical protein
MKLGKHDIKRTKSSARRMQQHTDINNGAQAALLRLERTHA